MQVDVEAALRTGHERPHHAVSLRGRRRRSDRLHADRRAPAGHAPAAAHPARSLREGRTALLRRGGAALRLRPREADIAVTDDGAVFASPDLDAVAARLASRSSERRKACAPSSSLEQGQSATFVLEQGEQPRPYSEDDTRELLNETVDYWLRWICGSALPGALARDGATLGADAEAADVAADRRARRGADYEPAGAHRRRAQLGLPLHVDSRRGVHALRADAARLHRGGGGVQRVARGPLPRSEAATVRCRSCTRIDGGSDLAEEMLDHLDGYRGSRPVRIGNGAADQLQLDIYGELMDSVYLYNKYGAPICHDALEDLGGSSIGSASNWYQPDEGIWETRGGRQRLHVLAADVLGRDRSRRCGWRASAAFPADLARWVEDARRDLRGDHGGRAGTRSATRSSSITAPTCRRVDCC